MEASLARERQESARSNILNARLEQRIAELEMLLQTTQIQTQSSIETNENITLNSAKRSTNVKPNY